MIEVEARLNVAADGKRFRCDFMREGPVYFPENNLGVEVLRRETILAGLQSFIGKPLTLDHIDPRINVGDPVEFAKVSHGKVDNVGFDKETGWFFCEGDVATDAARTAAGERNPSCGYRVLSTGPKGRWNNLPYERELTGIEFHHLALDKKRARYEEAEFRLNAVTDNTGKIMKFALIRTIAAALVGGKPTVEEVEVPADATIKLGNGKEVRLNTVLESHAAAETAEEERKRLEAEEAEKSKTTDTRANAITDESIVVVGGKQVKVKDLTAAYEARENAAAAEETRKTTEARENATRGAADFRKLASAAETGASIRTDFPQSAGGLADGMKRGKY